MKYEDIRVARKSALISPSSRIVNSRRCTRRSGSQSLLDRSKQVTLHKNRLGSSLAKRTTRSLSGSPGRSTASSSRPTSPSKHASPRGGIKRPRRQIMPSEPRYNAGISWKEENDLKRALLASLQETRHCMDKQCSNESEEQTDSPSSEVPTTTAKKLGTANNNSNRSSSSGVAHIYTHHPHPSNASHHAPVLSHMYDDGSQDSSSVSTNNYVPKVAHVRAQRKFAQGSRPCSPCVTPVKSKHPLSAPPTSRNFTTSKAKTEDFLTFLCLRGTPALPPHLDFYNIEDSDENSHTSTPGTPKSYQGSNNLFPKALARFAAGAVSASSSIAVADSSNNSTPDQQSLTHHDLATAKALPMYNVTPTSSPTKVCRKFASPTRRQIPNKTKQSKSTGTLDLPRSNHSATCSENVKCRDQSRDRKLDTMQMTPAAKTIDRSKKLLKKAKTVVAQQRRTSKRFSSRDLSVSPEVMPKAKCRASVERSDRSPVKHDRKEELRLGTEILVDSDDSEIHLRVSTVNSECLSKQSTSSAAKGEEVTDSLSPRKKHKHRSDKDRSKSKKLKSKSGKSKYKDKDKLKKKQKNKHRKDKKSKRERKKRRREAKALKNKEAATNGETSKDGESSSSSSSGSSSATLELVTSSETEQQRMPRTSPRTNSPLRASSRDKTGSLSHLRDGRGGSGSPVSARVRDRGGDRAADMTTVTVDSGNEGLRDGGGDVDNGGDGDADNNIVVIQDSDDVINISDNTDQSPASSPAKPCKIPAGSISYGFPEPHDPAHLIDTPTYHPSTEQFQDPIGYIQSIRPNAEPYGMCTIVPPEGWKPECQIRDDMRFACHIQYIHRMQQRWGPNTLKLECIKKHLESQDIKLDQSPMISGVELDLPSFHEAMKHHGGLQNVIDKNKWAKIMETLKIPKVAHERTSRMYECYCKYLVSYDTLTREEKQKLEQVVCSERSRKRNPYIPECVVKCKSRQLEELFKYAKYTEAVWFNGEPTPQQVEEKYWQLLAERRKHISIHVGQLDTAVYGSGFPSKRDSPYARHGWNLNIMQHNAGSLLTHIGRVHGLSTPMLHANMLFTTKCWSRDLHLLPYVTYHHTGAPKNWYCVPVSEEEKFHKVVKELNPLHVANKPVWLLPNEVMIPPSLLVKRGVSVGRTVQQPGQFVVVFAQSFTSSLSCGYNITESLKFAPADWIDVGHQASKALYASGLTEQISIEELAFNLVQQDNTSLDMLKLILPHLQSIVQYELDMRSHLYEIGLHTWERLDRSNPPHSSTHKKQKSTQTNTGATTAQDIPRCDTSSKLCYLSMVVQNDGSIWCLQNASSHLRRKPKTLKQCKLLYRWDEKELNSLLENARRIVQSGDASPRKRKLLKLSNT